MVFSKSKCLKILKKKKKIYIYIYICKIIEIVLKCTKKIKIKIKK